MASRLKFENIQIPEGMLPPVFGDPPKPPNPSVAPSTAVTAVGEIPTINSSGPNTAAGLTTAAADEDAERGRHGPSRADQDCDCNDVNDSSILPSDIPVDIDALLSKFSTTSMNDVGIFSSEAMMERLTEALNPKQYTPIHGLTAPEVKRQRFHCYLKASGLLGAIGKIILSLYETDPLPPPEKVPEHIESLLNYTFSMRSEIAEIKAYNQMLNIRIQRLEVENDWMRRRLDDFGPAFTEVEYLNPDEFNPTINGEKKLPDPLEIHRRPHRRHGKSHVLLTNIPTDKTVVTRILSEAVQRWDEAEKNNVEYAKKFLETTTT